MKLTSLTSVANTFAKAPATTKATPAIKPAATTKPAIAPAKTKATPATAVKATVPALANVKEEKKYGNPEKIMKMVEKMYLTLTKFENAIDDLWANKHVLTMEQSELFSVFYAKDFLNECMKKNEVGVMHMYPKFIAEVTSIGDNFGLIEKHLSKSLINELLEFSKLAEEL